MKTIVTVTICIGMLVAGCSAVPHAKNLQGISLGMTKQEIRKRIGEPRVVRGAIRNQYNQNIEVWEYRFELPSDDSLGDVVGKATMTLFTFGIAAGEFAAPQKDYWLYFYDGKLAHWGEAGDWQTERTNIYRVNFGEKVNL